MAGFFDGEGYVGIAHVSANGAYALHVEVAQKRREPLELFQRYFGGKLRLNKSTGVHQWGATASEASVCLQAIRPYLRLKGDQADIGIEFQARRGKKGQSVPHGRRELDIADFHRIRRLKRPYLDYPDTEILPDPQFSFDIEDAA